MTSLILTEVAFILLAIACTRLSFARPRIIAGTETHAMFVTSIFVIAAMIALFISLFCQVALLADFGIIGK